MKHAAYPSFRFARQRLFSWKAIYEQPNGHATLTPDRRLRVGIVGGGDIGLRNATCVQSAPAAIVAGVCDRNPAVLRGLTRQFEAPAYADYPQMLASPDIDAVLLNLPHHLHEPFARQAAQAGKHVMLEKPLGVNLADATQIVTSCRDAGVRLTVNFSYRYRPVIELARQAIEEELLGDICGTQITFLHFKGASYWAGGFTARAAGDWRKTKAQAGGGVLIITVCHHIDFVRYCIGLEVVQVTGGYGTFGANVEVEDMIALTMTYDNGAIGSITSSSHWRAAMEEETRIWGTHGALTINGAENLTLWSARRWRQLRPAQEYHFTLPVTDYTTRWIQCFATAVANDEPHDITGEDGWINNAVIEAAYQTQSTTQPVEVAKYLEGGPV
jgi:predicted dehydrogenase